MLTESRRRFSMALTLMVLLTGTAFATTYHVSLNGSDITGDGSQEAPFRSVSHTLVVAEADPNTPHTISIAAGTYTHETGEQFPLPLISSTTLSGAGAEETILDASGGDFNVLSAIGANDWTIEHLTITGGTWIDGGGLFASSGENILISDVVFRDNRADNPFFPESEGSGGGAEFFEVVNAILDHVLFQGNSAYDIGGALSVYYCSLVMNHVTIAGNSVDGPETSDAVYFTDNDQDNTLTITSSIVWRNGNDDGATTTLDVNGELDIFFSIVENEGTTPWPGTGNLWNDPLFTDPGEDFTLLQGSWAIDLADPTDAYGNEPQPNGNRANAGFFGGTATAQISESTTDLNRNTWRLIGLPVDPPTGDAAELFGDELQNEPPGEDTWRLQQWDPVQGIMLRYGEPEEDGQEYGDPSAMQPGQGYLIRQSLQNSVTLSVPGRATNQADTVAVPLASAEPVTFQMAANPYPYTINLADTRIGTPAGELSFAEAASGGWIVRWVYTLGTSGRFVPGFGVLGPWQGAVIATFGAEGLEWRITPQRNGSAPADPLEGLVWGLQVSAAVLDSLGRPLLHDDNHLFGIGPESEDGFDPLDAPLLQWLPVNMTFRWIAPDGSYLFHDFRPSEGGVWRTWRAEVIIDDFPADSVEYRVEGITEQYPDPDYLLQLVDEAGNVLLPDLHDSTLVRVPVVNIGNGSRRAEVRIIAQYPEWNVADNDRPQTLPEKFRILHVYPNPFNNMVNISYYLPREGTVRLRVYDLLGRVVYTSKRWTKSYGEHRLAWKASGFPSGIYFIRLESDRQTMIRKVILLK